jgi:hypothetical protein
VPLGCSRHSWPGNLGGGRPRLAGRP